MRFSMVSMLFWDSADSQKYAQNLLRDQLQIDVKAGINPDNRPYPDRPVVLRQHLARHLLERVSGMMASDGGPIPEAPGGLSRTAIAINLSAELSI